MIGLLYFALAVLASPFKSKMRLEAENVVLRHQLIVLRPTLRGRVQLTNNDRWFFIQSDLAAHRQVSLGDLGFGTPAGTPSQLGSESSPSWGRALCAPLSPPK